jgi:hypothetical protein
MVKRASESCGHRSPRGDFIALVRRWYLSQLPVQPLGDQVASHVSMEVEAALRDAHQFATSSIVKCWHRRSESSSATVWRIAFFRHYFARYLNRSRVSMPEAG